MPCFDGRDSDRDNGVNLTDEQYTQLKRAEAALCAINSTLETLGYLEDILGRINWDKVGVSKKQFMAEHKKQDEARKRTEDAIRATEAKRLAALNKLTLEERALLGIK